MDHRQGIAWGYESRRPTSRQRGYTAEWEAARAVFLLDFPACYSCAAQGIVTAASQVDHHEPHRGDPVRFWDVSNWRAMCASCHSKKTRAENKHQHRTRFDPKWYDNKLSNPLVAIETTTLVVTPGMSPIGDTPLAEGIAEHDPSPAVSDSRTTSGTTSVQPTTPAAPLELPALGADHRPASVQAWSGERQ